MPYLRQPTQRTGPDDEEAAPTLTTAGGGVASRSGAPVAGPSGPATAQGGGFANLADYVRVNQGGAQQMADKVVGGVEQQGSIAQGTIQQRQPNTLSTGQTAAAAPNDATFNRQANEARQVGQAQTAQQNVGLLGSWGGRGELLNQTYGQNPGGYSAGENALDNALLSNAAGARMQGAQSRFTGLADYVRGQQQSKYATEAKAAQAAQQSHDAASAAAAAAAEAKRRAEEEAKKKTAAAAKNVVVETKVNPRGNNPGR